MAYLMVSSKPMVAVCPEHLNIVTCRFEAIHLRLNFQILGNTTSGLCVCLTAVLGNAYVSAGPSLSMAQASV